MLSKQTTCFCSLSQYLSVLCAAFNRGRTLKNHNREWALRLTEAGFSVFPYITDKHLRIDDCDETSSSNADVVASWSSKFSGALPAIDTRKCGLMALDGDHHGEPGVVTPLHDLLSQQAAFDGGAMPTVCMPGDGIHAYVRNDPGFANATGAEILVTVLARRADWPSIRMRELIALRRSEALP
jgi:hypothetical protein